MTHGERFDRYMAQCLYGPDGFYSGSGSAGRRGGDFITSPEVGPLFGSVVANAIDDCWQRLGRPDPLPVYDVGCGPGTLLKAIAQARPDRPWQLLGVDVGSASGASLTELPADLTGAVVLANELVDNMPFRVFERQPQGLFEVHVAAADDQRDGDSDEHGEGGYREVLIPSEERFDIPVGTRASRLDAAKDWLTRVLAGGPAMVVLFDYGAPTTEALATRGGWLRTYREHQRGSDPYFQPGRWDITTDVAWDQLPPPNTLETQADYLRRWGIEQLVADGRAYWKAHAAVPDLAAIRMRSRISEAESLLDEHGLGGWLVGTWPNDSMDSRVG